MFRPNALKSRLTAGEPTFGVLASLGSAPAVEALAQAGVDFVIVDGEHGLGGPMDHLHCLQAIGATPATALYRIAAPDPVRIKVALDMGVEGLVVPNIQSGSQARDMVAACRYPPRGVRGYAAPIVRASDYGTSTTAYLAAVEAETMVIPMIESAAGVAASAEIAGTDGVDCVMVGTVDLAYDIGIGLDLDHPKLVAALHELEAGVRSAGKFLGGPLFPGSAIADLLARGYRLFTIGFDVMLLSQGVRQSLAAVRPPTA